MTKCIFIAGTDTDVGKTHISSLILKAMKKERLLTCGFKPIASGGILTADQATGTNALRNPDALALQRHAGLGVPYDIVNPFCFEPAIAPHVAAADAGIQVTVADLVHALARLKQAFPLNMDKKVVGDENARHAQTYQAQVIVCEGAGGWHVPLNDHERLSDWVHAQQMDVILVVGLKLGCINHALLSCQAIASAGLNLLGWVANRPSAQPMSREAETLTYLQGAIEAPLIADVSFSETPADASFDSTAQATLIKLLG